MRSISCALAVWASCLWFGVSSASLLYQVASEAGRRQGQASELRTDCYEQLADIAEAYGNSTRWALQMSDASKTPESGVYWNAVYWPASSYDCLKPDTEDPPPFPVGYFLLHSHLVEPKSNKIIKGSILSGFCVPASCSPEQLDPLVGEYYRTSEEDKDDTTSFDQTVLFSTLKYMTAILLGWTTFSTIIELVYDHQNNNDNTPQHIDGRSAEVGATKKLLSFMTAFSLSKNYNKLTNMKREEDVLPVLNGFRMFGTFLMISTHVAAYFGLNIKDKSNAVTDEDSFNTQMMYFATFGVDDFFIVSGFLLGYNFFKTNDIWDESVDKTIKRNVTEYLKGILRRYLRLTPIYLYTILLSGVTYAYLSPTFSINIAEHLDSACSRYWWTNMLYINNLYPSTEEYCVSWSYYLANDMQYYVIGSLLLYISIFDKKSSLLIGLAICLLSGGFIAALVVYHDFLISAEALFKHVDILYIAPWIRITAYLSGVFVSYVYTYFGDLTAGKPVIKSLMWIFYLSGKTFAAFGFLWGPQTVGYTALYMSLARIVYAVVDSLCLYFIITDNILAKLTTFMSHDVWIPLAKLSYGAYLINPLVISCSAVSTDKFPLVRRFHYLLSSFGVSIMTFLLSFLMVLFIEIPFNNLTNTLLPKQKKAPTSVEEVFYDCNIKRPSTKMIRRSDDKLKCL